MWTYCPVSRDPGGPRSRRRGNMPHSPGSVTLCLLSCLLTGSALDISDVTLINPDPVVSSADASLLCVSSDWTSPGTSSLSLGREYPAHQQGPLPSKVDTPYRSAAKVTWKTRNDIFGAFFCQPKNSDDNKVYTYKMLNEAGFLPKALTVTASVGDDVVLSYTRRKVAQEDTVIYKIALQKSQNGASKDASFEHSVPKEDIMDTVQYTISNVRASHAGLYTIRYISEVLPTSAITHLIVRSCSADMWGSNCTEACPACANGGVCDDKTGECICPPGFKGPTCETVCGEGRFGRSCKDHCIDGQCRSLVFCLREPYGCSCASGWMGLNCSEECPPGYYGADCKQKCMCDEGRCDRFRGCLCPGRHGAHCENEDEAPVIVSSLTDTELNSGVAYSVNCTARGQPAPLHGEILLLKPDKNVLYPVDTETVDYQTTSVFRVDNITVAHRGRWVCQVKTTSVQVEKDFIVNVKVPPQPRNPPSLNSSGLNHLVVLVNKDPYIGDGPVTSVKVMYKQANSSKWESVEVSGSRVKLENLSPMTEYTAFVQLSRPGAGGTGYPGPEANFFTKILDVSFPQGVRLTPLNLTSLFLSWDPTPSTAVGKDNWFYEVTCQQVDNAASVRSYQLPANSTGTQLTMLKPRHKYQCTVRLSNWPARQSCPTISAWTLSDVPPPAPSDISTSNITDSSAIISWTVSEGHSISKVIIWYKEMEPADYNQQVELGVQAGQINMQFQLRGLKPRTEYLLDLWTINNMGESEKERIPLRTSEESARLYGFGADGNMLFYAILGSAGMTCLTILLAFCIVLQLKRASFQRRMREEPVVQFSSDSLTMPKKPRTSTHSVAYPTLDWSDIKFQDVIGEGNFGQVLKARIKKDGHRMDAAIKRMKEYASKDDHRDFAGELEVLCKLGHHPNIINLLGACEHRGYLYLAIEYAPHGNLLDFLRKSRVLETDPAFAIANSTASTLSSQQLLHFAADVARGMDYLSQKQFIHRDLAARNILVGENFVAKIADFGLSRGQEVYVKKTMGRLPVRWMAIESLNYSVYTTNSDVWSYGVLLWEVVSLGGTPYCGMTCAELYEKLPQGYRLEKPLNCDDEVYELMRQCWREKPYERPSFAQILMSLNRMLEERKTYVNTTLYEKFTYAGIDCSAEEAG
ncbi:tyrosine-protein kinase receptor Tie-2 isoform X1 [Colossoma macropomum]|uniref:tyrosine-protein kinase receptor Tie-2 isoform X1 n=1 Tax=Colossoma macropomum TaxID=42526 RepID=UPI001863DE2C|nr:tyrosine-protein kinase receptor Tie-2 isoform X1 [Colossoma macropomum]